MLSAEIILIKKSIFHSLNCPGEEAMPKINCRRIFAVLNLLWSVLSFQHLLSAKNLIDLKIVEELSFGG